MIKKRKKIDTIISVLAALLWVGASVIMSQLVIGIIMVNIIGREAFGQPVAQTIYSALTYILSLLLVIWVPMRLRVKRVSDAKKQLKNSRELLGLKGLPTWTDVGLAPIGFIVSLILAAGLVWIFSIFPWFDAGETQGLAFSVYVSGVDRIIAFITLVVMAPIAEEIIFRGWLYGYLRKKLSRETSDRVSMIISALLVSLLFGIIHLQWNVGVNVFALSLVMCAMREITSTIYAGMLMHMIKNGVAFYLLFVLGIS